MVARLGRRLLGVLGSFHLAVVLLLLLLLLTFVGTLEQAERSLFEVQQAYFGSAFVVHYFGGVVPIALPGAYLLLPLLFVNLLVGGVLRIRKARATLGILIAHGGILLLLVGGFVEDLWSAKGQVSLHIGESASFFRSATELEVVIREALPADRVREYRIPEAQFLGLAGGDSTRAHHDGLPFDLVLSHFVGDSEVVRAPSALPLAPAGLLIRPIRRTDDEISVRPALRMRVPGDAAHAEEHGVLWLLAPPWVVQRGEILYEVELRRRRWPLPFTVRLDRFVHEMHPGTGMARRFSSYVTRLEGGVEQASHITMNEPLRHAGYTFYQSGWGPQDAPAGTPLYSTLSVVRNPSDRIPLIACIVVVLGLLLHYAGRLWRFLAAAPEEEG